MTMHLDGIPGRFTKEYRQQKFRENIEKEKLEINNIKSQLVGKTFEEIKQIVKNIGDHPNPEGLINNLEEKPFFDEILENLSRVIFYSTFSVERILNISKK